MESNEYKDLGTMNGWHYCGGNPVEYDNCVALGHTHRAIRSATMRCYTYYFCDICKIKYEADSSD